MFAGASTRLGETLPGFDHVRRYWDKYHHSVAAKILPGEYYVTREEELVTTVLGSCVSACIRDRRLGLGGMNHFMLPATAGGDPGDEPGPLCVATRYGTFAMEHMINEILKHGGRKANFEAKIFGGGRIMHNLSDVGARNIEFVKEYLQTEGIALVSEDVGDIHPRKVVYFPRTGRALVRRLRHLHNDNVVQQENAYRKQIKRQPLQGDIELF